MSPTHHNALFWVVVHKTKPNMASITWSRGTAPGLSGLFSKFSPHFSCHVAWTPIESPTPASISHCPYFTSPMSSCIGQRPQKHLFYSTIPSETYPSFPPSSLFPNFPPRPLSTILPLHISIRLLAARIVDTRHRKEEIYSLPSSNANSHLLNIPIPSNPEGATTMSQPLPPSASSLHSFHSSAAPDISSAHPYRHCPNLLMFTMILLLTSTQVPYPPAWDVPCTQSQVATVMPLRYFIR